MLSVASSSVYQRNWASLDKALQKKFSSCFFLGWFCHLLPLFWTSLWSNNKCKSSIKYKQLKVFHMQVLAVAGASSQHSPKFIHQLTSDLLEVIEIT